MGAMVPDYDLVTKVTIIPRTNGAGGFTLFTPTEERLDSGMYSQRSHHILWTWRSGFQTCKVFQLFFALEK